MPPIVLLHAFPFDSAMFATQIAAFPGNLLLTPNLVGFGARPVKRPVTVFDQAEQIARDLDDQKIDKAIIGGVSMGGYVTLAFANRFPDRMAGLILADTRADADDETAKANRAKAMAMVAGDGVEAFVDLQLSKLLGESTRSRSPEIVAKARAIGIRQQSAGVLAGIEMLRDRPDWTEWLPSINAPTLIIVGEEDMVTPPKLARGMHEAISGSKLVIIPSAGHLSNLESPESFNAAMMEFVKSIDS